MARSPSQAAPPFASESTLVADAFDFAARAHHGPRRVADTNFDHPYEVARLVAEQGFSEEVVAAALLHDVVEDTRVSLEEIEARFGPEVGALVGALTEDEAIGPYTSRTAVLRRRTIKAGSEAAAILAADKIASLGAAAASGRPLPGHKLQHYRRTHVELEAAYPHLPLLDELRDRLAVARTAAAVD